MAADRKEVMFASLLILLCQIVISVYGRKTRDMIYVDINHFAPCIRRFNATHEIGCSSSASGNTGVVHYINDTDELNYVLNDGPHKPYIPIMTPQTFNLKNVELLLESKKVNGFIVIHSNVSQILQEDEVDFSPDRSCPNDNFGIYNEDDNSSSSSKYAHCSDVTWNPDGNSLNYMNLDVPVFSLLDQGEVDFLVECSITFNHRINGVIREYPLCAVELNNFMFGAKDTPTCFWRSQRITGLEQTQFCDPLGGYNLWSVLKPTNKKEPLQEKSVIFAAAQLDATSLFYEIMPRPGADSAVTSFVTLLATAHALGTQLSNETKQDMKNIMFAFFTGESYDYIGSSRMVFDMQRDEFPAKLYDSEKKADREQPALMNLTHISHYVELKQLGLTTNGNTVWAHSDPVSQENPDTKNWTQQIVDALISGSSGSSVSVLRPLSDQSLPPASFQRFLREKRDIPGIVLTDHEKAYSNKYYNSRFDVPVFVDPAYEDASENTTTQLAEDLRDVATTVARALYRLARPHNNFDSNNIVADLKMVNDLLYCFLSSPNCTLFKSVASPDEAQSLSYQNTPYSNYVGVYDGYSVSATTAIVRRLLAYYTGEATPTKSEKECTKQKSKNDEIFTYSFIQGPEMNETYGLCVKSIANSSPAQSPAFTNSTKESWSSTEYSTWTESRWSSYSARIFLKPSTGQESIIFSLGMIVLIVSLTTSYFLNARAGVLFVPNRTSY